MNILLAIECARANGRVRVYLKVGIHINSIVPFANVI